MPPQIIRSDEIVPGIELRLTSTPGKSRLNIDHVVFGEVFPPWSSHGYWAARDAAHDYRAFIDDTRSEVLAYNDAQAALIKLSIGQYMAIQELAKKGASLLVTEQYTFASVPPRAVAAAKVAGFKRAKGKLWYREMGR